MRGILPIGNRHRAARPKRMGRNIMTMNTCAVGLGLGLALLSTPSSFAEVTFDWATIGNAGNAADPTTGFGAVAYEYRMATTEVTNTQYAEFLNAVAATDDFGGEDPNLYNFRMAGKGLRQSGPVGSFTYSVDPGFENNPVVYTSFIDAMRFTNWLHNGQGTSGTEAGVYSDITDGTTETRADGGKYFLPNEDEWYKGAYHQPASQGGDLDDYWLYPMSSNMIPIGDVNGNFDNVHDNSIAVGSYSTNFYGLHDVGGNVREWNEGLRSAFWRSSRGGSWNDREDVLRSSAHNVSIPSFGYVLVGFRVGSPIPSPGPAVIMAVAATVLIRRRG